MESKITLLNCDCMDFMREQPDKTFELAIADPPYFEKAGVPARYRPNLATSDHKPLTEVWDKNIPGPEYFAELFRISKRQIIWGCNYYAHHIPHQSRIVWDKVNDNTPFSQAEIASYSEGVKVYMYRYKWNGMLQGDMKNKEIRIHPTQKPVRLYDWMLTTYAKPGQRIFDSHLGSASSAIAAHYFGVDFVGCEIDKHYYDLAVKRFRKETAQIDMFQDQETSCPAAAPGSNG